MLAARIDSQVARVTLASHMLAQCATGAGRDCHQQQQPHADVAVGAGEFGDNSFGLQVAQQNQCFRASCLPTRSANHDHRCAV